MVEFCITREDFVRLIDQSLGYRHLDRHFFSDNLNAVASKLKDFAKNTGYAAFGENSIDGCCCPISAIGYRPMLHVWFTCEFDRRSKAMTGHSEGIFRIIDE